MAEINFFKEDLIIDLRKLRHYKRWLTAVADSYKKEINYINYIFCSDNYLHEINLEYLNHDNLTDIITFDLRENNSNLPIEADIFISIDRVKENSKELKHDFKTELGRVIVHGFLHLIGFKDKTKEQKIIMREEEAKALLTLH